MSILQRIFGGRTKGGQYDLSHLGLPREGTSLGENIVNQRGKVAAHVSHIVEFDPQDIARKLHATYVTALEERAHVICCLNLSSSEIPQIRNAVKAGSVHLIPQLAKCPTYPIIVLMFVIYDDPTNPFNLEALPVIEAADTQDFISAVLNNGGGDLHLHTGANADPVGSGPFLLRTQSIDGSGFSYTTTTTDLKEFWNLVSEAAKHLKGIPADRRDYEAAVRLYREKVAF